MRTHTVIDGNAFYEVDDECMERLRLKKEDKTGDADIRAAGRSGYGFQSESNGKRCRKNR